MSLTDEQGPLPVYEKEPRDLPLGTKYILKGGCPECKGDLEVGVGVFVHCTRIIIDRDEPGGISKTSPCDYRLLAG